MTHAVSLGSFRFALLTTLFVSGACLAGAGKASAGNVFQCKGPTKDAVTACCLKETQQGRPAWMIGGNLSCQQAVSCGGSAKYKERCQITVPGTQNPSHETPVVRQYLSDARLKTNIHRIGTTVLDLPLYSFEYRGRPGTYIGVMAQDVLKVAPAAVSRGEDGFYRVDYGKLGIDMLQLP